jgi:ppGpp synthetase/RelA/SpoT-type nucleotidyltranferase
MSHIESDTRFGSESEVKSADINTMEPSAGSEWERLQSYYAEESVPESHTMVEAAPKRLTKKRLRKKSSERFTRRIKRPGLLKRRAGARNRVLLRTDQSFQCGWNTQTG